MIAALDRLIATADTHQQLSVSALLPSLRPLAERLIAGPAPRDSLLALRKVLEAAPSFAWPTAGPALDALAALLSSGPELTRLLARRPDRLAIVHDANIRRLPSKAQLDDALRTALPPDTPPDDVGSRLAAFRNDHYIRLAICEFLFSALEQVGRSLADLADVCVDHALRVALAETSQRLGTLQLRRRPPAATGSGVVAIAMGKHGARELNFCSDIDLLFVYATDEGCVVPTGSTASAPTIHEFFTAVVRRVVQLVSAPTEEGFGFRVDLRLRPEGSRGPICNSLAATEAYYETWGGPLDRLAWLKARPAAGDLGLGAEIVRALHAFVYPRSIGVAIIAEIEELSQRLRATLTTAQTASGWDVKLGQGGIRDIEFFVQALQLVHGGQQPTLQEPRTLAALDKLLFAGLISDQEHRQLTEAYDLYRRIEHRLQLHSGRQTHRLPNDGPLRQQILEHLARYGGGAPSLAESLDHHRAQVSRIYKSLSAAAGESDQVDALVARLLSEEAALACLSHLGFHDPAGALQQLQLLQQKPWGPFGQSPSPTARQVRVPLLQDLACSPDPDAALRLFGALALRCGPFDALWTLLRQNAEVRRLLCNLCGTSAYLGTMLVRQPALIDQLFATGDLPGTGGVHAVTAALTQRLSEAIHAAAAQADTRPRHEAQLEACRRFHNEEVLRIALADVAGDLDGDDVAERLSLVAETLLAALYPLVLAQVTERYGMPRHHDGSAATMAVIALGSLGARELCYGSDLDLVFVYSGEGQTDGVPGCSNSEFFARLAQRFIRSLSARMAHGHLYDVDARLRPSGNQGMLVCSRSAFAAYQQTTAAAWEHQALLRARPISGDAHLGAQLDTLLARCLFARPREGQALKTAIDQMRQRIAGELGTERDDTIPLKAGRGGLLDVQFIVQYLQLASATDHPELRGKSTAALLDMLPALGQLDGPSAAALAEGYRFLRRLEARLHMARGGRGHDRLPTAPQAVEVIARRLRYRRRGNRSAGEQLLADLTAQRQTIRAIYDRVFADD